MSPLSQRRERNFLSALRSSFNRRLNEFRSERLKPSVPGEVKLFYWRPNGAALNFGDHLSHVVVTKILADRGYLLEEAVATPKRLLAVGSILHFARNNDVVWGSGVNGKVSTTEHQFTQLDVRAVRGPCTCQFLNERGIYAPPVFGDPALLLPQLFPGRFERKSTRRRVIVPNLHDLPLISAAPEEIVSPHLPWNICVERILESDLVISSSLHGLIIAEAYGIPARLLRLSETENLLKYKDYIRGTGRSKLIYARSVEEAMSMEGMTPIQWNPEALLRAFPQDLWQCPGTNPPVFAETK